MLSSTEVEYVMLSKALYKACWLRNLYSELALLHGEVPMLIQGDNDGLIAMAKNPQFHKCSKHINICWHWVCKLVKEGTITIKDCCDPEQTADILTKCCCTKSIISI